jgi:signal transduction histidine kinase
MYAHQMLAETDALNEESRRQLDGIARLTVRMDGLLEALLEYSRVGRSKLVYEEVELGAVLDEAIEMVGARTAEKPCEFVVPRPLPTVRCDRTRIREVLVNLLSNALKYTDRPLRRIEVGYLTPLEYGTRSVLPIEARGHTVFFVRDNGLGIDRRHAEKIWKMFRRLHGRDAYGGGAGVGLTIVKKLIERHHGQVWVESALGEGSTFYFTLPAPQGAKGQAHEHA